jgi:hypothetical protein
VYIGQTVMARVVQRQHDDPFPRLAWNLGITRLDIALTNQDEWILTGGNHSNFPLSFNFDESVSLFSDSWRPCSSSLSQQDVHSEEAMFGLEWLWKLGSFYMEAESYFQEFSHEMCDSGSLVERLVDVVMSPFLDSLIMRLESLQEV